jgi:nucleotide-binding universal stress UspA family protein
MYSKILVPLDGSKTAEKVLPYARHLAGKFKIPVELLAVLDVAYMATHISADKARHLDTMVEDGMRASTTYLRGIATTFPEGNVTCTVEKDRAEEAIIGKAGVDGGTLIAMATHGRSGMDRFLLGSVAEKVLRGSANSLVLVRAKEEAKTSGEAPFKSIIVPLDGSELAESVIPLAATMANKLDLEVVLFRAYHMPYNAYTGDEGYMVNYDELIDSVRDEAKVYLDKQVAEVKKLGVARVSALSKEGSASDEIISLGHKTPEGLVAMCSHGRSGIGRWVLGSVTENVVRHSDAPVLVVRAR